MKYKRVAEVETSVTSYVDTVDGDVIKIDNDPDGVDLQHEVTVTWYQLHYDDDEEFEVTDPDLHDQLEAAYAKSLY